MREAKHRRGKCRPGSGQIDCRTLFESEVEGALWIWSGDCPDNFATKFALVSAEMARIEGRVKDAMHLYEHAVKTARESGFIQNAGGFGRAMARGRDAFMSCEHVPYSEVIRILVAQ